MDWFSILFTVSAVMFFGFVILCVTKFGLKSCYSDYGPIWAKLSPVKGFNWWSVVTTTSAFLLMVPLLQSSEGSNWQVTAFLCPTLIAIVGLTPDFDESTLALTVHMVCANVGALFAILFIILVVPKLWWLILLYCGLAGLCTRIFGKWCFWFEMAAYLLMYTSEFILLTSLV